MTKVMDHVRGRRWSPIGVRAWMLIVRLSGGLGGLVEKMAKGGRPAFITLALALVALRFFAWWEVLLAYGALLLLWLAIKATSRVVIDTFEEHTMPSGTEVAPKPEATSASGASPSPTASSVQDRPDPHRLDTTGMATLLTARLGEMRNVYKLLEEPLGSPHAERPLDGAVQLEDIGDVLRSAFTTQSSVSVGPITVPVGSVMALLGRLVQAPRLHGAIYGDDSQLTITAELSAQGRNYVWSVERKLDKNETVAHARAAMIEDLAYRVFTDLSLQGQAEWPATRDWFYALKERQACQRSPRERRVHLQNAEEHLRKALSQDERFYLAAYNLGIVYRQLAEHDAQSRRDVTNELRGVPEEAYTRSALRVFAYAIEKLDRGRWEAYYGLALAYWKRAEQSKLTEEPSDERDRRLERVVSLCDRAIDLAQSRAARAQILDLQATALGALHRLEHARGTWHTACREVLGALAFAQLTRIRDEADGQRLLRLRKQASQCVLNLAIAYYKADPDSVKQPEPQPRDPLYLTPRAWRYARIYWLATFAVRLADVDADTHARFADIVSRKPRLKTRELARAIRIDPDKPDYWVALAEVRTAEDRDAARTACTEAERAIDFAADPPPEDDLIKRLAKAYENVGRPERRDAVIRRGDLGREIAKARNSDRTRRQLEALLGERKQDGNAWETALVQRELGRYLLESVQPCSPRNARRAEKLFADAAANLDENDRIDIRRWGLPGAQASAIAHQHNRTREALPLAERGVSIDPLSESAWRALAAVREHGGDYESGCRAWKRVLMIEPGQPKDHVALAVCQWKLAEWMSDAGRRRDVYREALENLHTALELYDSEQMKERQRTEWWCAACHWMLGQFKEMPEHLSFILASIEDLHPSANDNALAARVELALSLSYRQTRNYAKAEEYAQRSIAHGNQAAGGGFQANGFPGNVIGEYGRTLGEIRALARAHLAGCHADRDGRLPFAEAQVRSAERLMHEGMADGSNGNPRQPRNHVERDLTELEGRVLGERGRIALARRRVKEAVGLLERSTRKDPGEADIYVALACAYERLAAEQDAPEREWTLEKAAESCRRAKDIVGRHHPHWGAANAVEERVKERERTPSPAIAALVPATDSAKPSEPQPATRM